MAQFNFENASLRLYFETGIDEQGQPIVTSKTFQNVRETVSANQIENVVTAIASLTKDPVSAAKLVKVDTVEL